MPDDFCLQKEEHISAVVKFGDNQSAKIEDIEFTIELSEPKMKASPIKIEHVEYIRRGATSGLF